MGITMCGVECARSQYCQRHPDSGTIPDKWQSWFAPSPDIYGCNKFVSDLSKPVPAPHVT